MREADGARWILFQLWNPHPPLYDTTMYVVEDRGSETRTHTMRATYYALPVARLMELMRDAGFEDVRRLDEDAFYQPRSSAAPARRADRHLAAQVRDEDSLHRIVSTDRAVAPSKRGGWRMVERRRHMRCMACRDHGGFP